MVAIFKKAEDVVTNMALLMLGTNWLYIET